MNYGDCVGLTAARSLIQNPPIGISREGVGGVRVVLGALGSRLPVDMMGSSQCGRSRWLPNLSPTMLGQLRYELSSTGESYSSRRSLGKPMRPLSIQIFKYGI